MNDTAVLTAAKGYIYTAPVGTKAPKPEDLKDFNADTFGAVEYSIEKNPTGTFTLEYNGETTDDIDDDASSGTIQDALNGLDGVESGTFVVTGGPLDEEDMAVYVHGSHELTSSDATVEREKKSNGWKNVGHTSRGTLPEFGQDGGDTEVKGTWQNESLREIESETPVDYVTFVSNQMSEDSLVLYYGRNSANDPGVFGVAGGTSKAVERAILIVIVDGDTAIANYARKVSIRRDDTISISTDEFTEIPIRATYLKDGNNRLFDWLSPDTGIGGSDPGN